MPSFKTFSPILCMVLAIGGFSASGASAARFTYNPFAGTLSGSGVGKQVISVNGGKVECNAVELNGAKVQFAPEKQDYSAIYRECIAFGLPADVSQVTYGLTADGRLHIESTLKIGPTFFGTMPCILEIKPQIVSSVDFSGSLTVTSTMTGITYTSTGEPCGSSGSNGTYSGTIAISGGSITIDP